MKSADILSLVRAAILLLLLVTVVTCYYPGLRGPFVFDDQSNITGNPAIAITTLDVRSLHDAALASDSGPLKRPLASLSFALNYYLAGGFQNSFPFKATNLAVHLINVCLVYWLVSLLLGQLPKLNEGTGGDSILWVPPLAAAVWGLHPLHLTSVLYVVQRMNSLSVLFVLVGLILFVHGRQRLQRDKPRGLALMVLGWGLGIGLGVGAKENAILLPLYMLVIEFVFFQDKTDRTNNKALTYFYTVTVFMPFLFSVIWFVAQPQIITDTYRDRDFTLVQRLATEPRVLWFYLSLLIFPTPGRFGLFHDDFVVSTGLLTPWTTLIAITGVIALLVWALVARRKYPFASFAILWYLAGHSLESGVIGLEIAHEHRNYLPDLGPIFAIVTGATTWLARLVTQRVALALLLTVVITLAAITRQQAQVWASDATLIETTLAHHPNSISAHFMMGQLLSTRRADPIGALTHYRRAWEIDHGEVGYLIHMAMIASGLSVVQSGSSSDEDNTNHHKSASSADGVAASLGIPLALISTSFNGERRFVPTTDETKRISKQLALTHPGRFALAALNSLYRCVSEQPERCGFLYTMAVEWHRASLLNPRLGHADRHRLAIQLFELAMSRGDHALALQTAHAAHESDPGETDYVLMEANVQIARKQFDAAERILAATLASNHNLSRDTQDKIEVLRSMISERYRTRFAPR